MISSLAGLQISTINCDNEFRPLIQELQDVYNVRMNYANPQEHVPEAERNNRVIKERFRAAFHRLPFKKIPKIMVIILTMESAKKLNFFPPRPIHYSYEELTIQIPNFKYNLLVNGKDADYLGFVRENEKWFKATKIIIANFFIFSKSLKN